MIQIKNKVGSDVTIYFDDTSEVISDNILIDIETLNCCKSKQGIARMIALIQSENFKIYKNSIYKGVEGHVLLNRHYNELFN